MFGSFKSRRKPKPTFEETLIEGMAKRLAGSPEMYTVLPGLRTPSDMALVRQAFEGREAKRLERIAKRAARMADIFPYVVDLEELGFNKRRNPILLPSDPEEKFEQWLEGNCEGAWLDDDQSNLIGFTVESDAVAFRLWAGQ